MKPPKRTRFTARRSKSQRRRRSSPRKRPRPRRSRPTRSTPTTRRSSVSQAGCGRSIRRIVLSPRTRTQLRTLQASRSAGAALAAELRKTNRSNVAVFGRRFTHRRPQRDGGSRSEGANRCNQGVQQARARRSARCSRAFRASCRGSSASPARHPTSRAGPTRPIDECRWTCNIRRRSAGADRDRGLRGAGHRFVRINCVGPAVWTDRIEVEGGQVLVGKHRLARPCALLSRARRGVVPHADHPRSDEAAPRPSRFPQHRSAPAGAEGAPAGSASRASPAHAQAPPRLRPPRRRHGSCPQARPGRRGHALPGGGRPVVVEEEEGEGSVCERGGRRRLDRRPPEPSGGTGDSARRRGCDDEGPASTATAPSEPAHESGSVRDGALYTPMSRRCRRSAVHPQLHDRRHGRRVTQLSRSRVIRSCP